MPSNLWLIYAHGILKIHGSSVFDWFERIERPVRLILKTFRLPLPLVYIYIFLILFFWLTLSWRVNVEYDKILVATSFLVMNPTLI